MNSYQRITSYIEEIAARNTAIAHNMSTGTSREARRFFLWGSNDSALMAQYAINNTGWNLLLDVVDGTNVDNRHDYEAHTHRIALHFVRHCHAQDIPLQKSTTSAAFDLGWNVLRHMRAQAQNPCLAVDSDAISSAAIVPRMLDWPGIRYQPLCPLLFVGDEHYGYRFEVTVKYDVPLIEAENPTDWTTLP